MPKVSDLFPPDRIKAADLTGPVTVIVRSALFEQPGYNGGVEHAIEVELHGRISILKVGQMLAADIVAVIKDDESLNWINKAISIYPFELTIKDKGETKTVIMIRASAATEIIDGAYSNGQRSSKPRNDMGGDAIPF